MTTPFHDLENMRLEVEVTPSGLVNLVQNPSGDKGAWNYLTPVNNTKLVSFLYNDAPCLNFSTTVSQASYVTTDYIPITAGQYAAGRYTLEGFTSGHGTRVRFEWFNSSKVFLSASTQSSFNDGYGVDYFAPGTVAPASTAFVRMRIDFYKTSSSNPDANASFDFRNVMVAKAATNAFSTQRLNRIGNPSFETNVAGWGSYGISAVRSTAQAWRGSASLQIQSQPNDPTLAAAYVNAAVVGGKDFAYQARMKTTNSANAVTAVQVDYYTSNGGTYISSAYGDWFSLNSTWKVVSLVSTAPVNATYARISYNIANIENSSRLFYLDASMVEQASSVGAYFDGSQAASGSLSYAWTGTTNNSTSTESNTALAYADPWTWQNILGPTVSIDIDRKALDVGTMSAVIEDALLDPAVSSDIRPGKQVRLRTLVDAANNTWESVYEGRINNAQVVYDLDKSKANLPITTTITLTAQDNISVLANQGESRGVATIAELPYLLEGKNCPWKVNGLGNQVGNATVVSSNSNASVVDQVALTRDTAAGYVWVDRNNVLTAYDSASMPSGVSCYFSDVDPGTVNFDVYNAIDAGYNTDDVINQIIVKWLRYNATTGTSEEITYGPYSDAASIATYGPRQKDFTWHGSSESPSTIASKANAIIAANKTPVRRANSLNMPVRDARSFKHATRIDLYSKVGVVFGSVLNNTYRVTSINHKITSEEWDVSYGFAVDGGVASPTMTPSPGGPVDNTDGTWLTPTLASGWTDYGGTYVPVRYMRKDGMVTIQCMATTSSINSTIFTLPAGYRPAYIIMGAGVTQNQAMGNASAGTAHTHSMTNGSCRVDVLPTGVVQVLGMATGSTWAGFTITFPVEA